MRILIFKILATLCSIIAFNNVALTQDVSIKVEVSSDSVLYGNYISLKYTIINTDGNFVPPDFNDFRVVSGPNVSSQFSMINGKVTQKSSYSYHLLPSEVGSWTIESARIEDGREDLEFDAITITVLPNPDGQIENPGSTLLYSRTLPDSKIKDGSEREDSLNEADKLLNTKLKRGKKYKI